MASIQTLYGKCRCCLKEGEHRDIMKEYYCEGTREVYFDIFLECFNVFLSTFSETSNLICLDCIERLREANAFRIMVVNAEKHLQSVTDPPDSHVMIKHEVNVDVKLEPKDDVSHSYMETKSKDFDDEDAARLARDEACLLSRFPLDKMRALPTRDTLYAVCPKYVMHLDMLQGKKTDTKDIEALLMNTDTESKANSKRYITEKNAHVHNAAQILENSNATAFKGKSRTGLPCFYCKHVLENVESLRLHQKEHKKSDIRKSLASYSPNCLIINVDITNLKCKLCDISLNSIKDLKTHLVSVHKKRFYTEFQDRVVPFKVPMDNNFLCQICENKYETFGSIERHMNIHYRNYICDECGTGFVTSYRMKMHTKTMHAGGSFKCECGKVFSSHQKRKSHIDTVHKMIKRFKCPKCSERFTDYFKRQEHMVKTHGVAELQYKCNVCDKIYARRYMLSRHMKRDHLEERYFQCDVCLLKFFGTRDLKSHMVKHNGARIFECSVCNKAYARKKTLREHMRIHNNDRRFACAVCGHAFVQNCSLKAHVRTHHPEVSSNKCK